MYFNQILLFSLMKNILFDVFTDSILRRYFNFFSSAALSKVIITH